MTISPKKGEFKTIIPSFLTKNNQRHIRVLSPPNFQLLWTFAIENVWSDRYNQIRISDDLYDSIVELLNLSDEIFRNFLAEGEWGGCFLL